MNEVHIPVLLSDVIKYLRPQSGETYLDLTAGYGGHADKILEVTRNYNGAVLNDRDQNAINFLSAKYQTEKPKLIHSDFYNTALRLVENNEKFDMILADFGVSSPQLDRAERGFSFAQAARLDMRMDESQDLDAWQIVNKWSERKLAEIFHIPGGFTKMAVGKARSRHYLHIPGGKKQEGLLLHKAFIRKAKVPPESSSAFHWPRLCHVATPGSWGL